MRHVFARSRFTAAAAALAVCALTATMFASTPAYADATDPSAGSPSPASTSLDTAPDGETAADADADTAPAPTPTNAVATPEITEPAGASTGEAATPESTEPDGGSSDAAATPESAESAADAAQPFAALADISPLADISALAAGVADQCVYANASGGQYADALCWLDLSYIDSAGKKAPITTQWVQTAGPTTTGISSDEFASTLCEYRQGDRGSNYRRTTITFESVLGAAYGSATFAGCARATSAQTAADNSVTQATNAVSATLYVTGGTHYGNVTNYPLSLSLSGGAYTFTANLSITAPAASSGRAVRAVGFPSWSGAYLGNSIYEVPAAIRDTVYPALYQAAGAATTTATLSGIQITRGGTAYAGYSVVVADAESTDNGESIRWTQSGGQGFRWLPNNPTDFSAVPTGNNTTNNTARKTAAVGNACAGTPVAQWPSLTPPSVSDVTCSAGSSQSSPKTGTAMLQALPPANGAGFSVTQAMTGNGLQGVAFGLLMARASVTVNVADRVVDATGAATVGTFDASMTHPGGTVTAQTGATGLTAAQQLELPVDAAGMQLNFATTTAAPSASSYTVAWVCTKTGSGGSSRWPTAGSSATAPPTNSTWFRLQAGQFIDCNVTYTPPYVTLTKSVVNGATGAANVPADWTLTSTGSQSKITGATQTPSVTRRAVATGTYVLTETGPAGYDWTNLVCTASAGGAPSVTRSPTTGTIASANLTVSAGHDITCAYTNTARLGTITWAKTDVDTGVLIGGSVWSLVGPSGSSSATISVVDNTGQSGYSGRDTDPVAGRFTVTALTWGTYTLTEATPPAGYVGTATPTTVTVGGAATTANAGTITNMRVLQFGVAKFAYAAFGSTVPLAGSEFAVLTDAGGQPGAPVSGAAVTPVAGNPGTFSLTGLRPGTYWLQETKAPVGHELLAELSQFRVVYDSTNTTPRLELVAGDQALVKLSSDKQTLNVYDVPSLILPLTGGSGTTVLTLGGTLLLAAVVLGALWWRRRRAPSTPSAHDGGAS